MWLALNSGINCSLAKNFFLILSLYIAIAKGYYCGSPDVANGTFFVIGGMNVTENRTYVDGTVATYKCINFHDHLINATDSKNQNYLRRCVTKNWTGRAPLCG